MLPLGLLCLFVCLDHHPRVAADIALCCAARGQIIAMGGSFYGSALGVDKHVSPPIRLKANPTPTEWLAKQAHWDRVHHTVEPNVHVA